MYLSYKQLHLLFRNIRTLNMILKGKNKIIVLRSHNFFQNVCRI